MRVVKDQMGLAVTLPERPQRIISLVPSQTEFLHAIGLAEEVVGITKFCVHPQEWFQSKKRVGGTKNVDFEAIRELQPDLIIGNKEENSQADIEQLSAHYPVWMSDISDYHSAIAMMEAIGAITQRKPQASAIIESINKAFNDLKKWPDNQPGRVLYLIWDKPIMAAGANTFIHDMLHRMGFTNVAAFMDPTNQSPAVARYPVITPEALKDLKPDFVLLSSEPYPFKAKHLEHFSQLFPNAWVMPVDGELFSWYGSRMIDAPAYFNSLTASLNAPF